MARADRQHVLRLATATLRAAGNPSARVDAELLLAHVLGVARGQLVLSDDVPPGSSSAFDDLVLRRASGVPLQHLTGRAPFRHLELAVGPGVFIPRPETEVIVDIAGDYLESAGTVVDLCSGSGAIALSVAHEFPHLWVIAVERSAAALEWLRRNASGTAVEIVDYDIADPHLLSTLDRRVDVVLANPPYVPETPERLETQKTPETEGKSPSGTRLASVPVEVGHDPGDAVFAGPDGLALMPALIATAARLLRPGGFLATEHDESHGEVLPAMLEATGDWRQVADHVDLNGRPRFASAVRR